MEIHIGANTQSQLQLITPQSFKTIKAIVSAEQKPRPLPAEDAALFVLSFIVLVSFWFFLVFAFTLCIYYIIYKGESQLQNGYKLLRNSYKNCLYFIHIFCRKLR